MCHLRKNKKERIQDVKNFIGKTRANSSNIVDGILYKSLERLTREGDRDRDGGEVPKILVENGDTLIIAQEYGATCILSMASPYNRGGGVFRGASSQEEALCARTDLYSTLLKYDNTRLPDRGGIYSPKVNILRTEDLKPIVNNIYNVSVISCAGIKNPDLTDDGRLNDKDAELTLEKMKFILRCADKYGHKIIVLGALGCGAYSNPPSHIVQLWDRAIFGSKTEKKQNKTEKWNYIQTIIFAIKDKPHEKNYQIFKDYFEAKT